MTNDYTRQDWNRDVRRGYCTVHDGEGREVRLPIVDNSCLQAPEGERMFTTHEQGPKRRNISEDSNPLLKWRMERNLKQNQAAIELGIARQAALSEMECGKREIPQRILEIIGGAT